jgi:hypothetical protein
MAPGRQDDLAGRLLAPLHRVEPVRLAPATRGRRRRRSVALAVALAVAAGGLAAAAVSGPLGGAAHRCPFTGVPRAGSRPAAACTSSRPAPPRR